MNHYLFVMFWASFTSALCLLFNFLELEESYQLETYKKWFKLFHSTLIKLTSFRCMSRLVVMLSVIWFKVLRSVLALLHFFSTQNYTCGRISSRFSNVSGILWTYLKMV